MILSRLILLRPLGLACPLQPLRQLQQLRHASTNGPTKHSVSVFGELRVRTGHACNILVRPDLSLDQDVAFVDQGANKLALKVEYDNSRLTVRIDGAREEVGETQGREGDQSQEGQRQEQTETCVLDVPVKYNLDIKVERSSNVIFENLQNDKISVETELGDCTFRKILTGSMTVRSKGGNIISEKVLQGNAILETQGSGSVRVSKPLCQTLSARTCHGDIGVTSLYADESTFLTLTGDVVIGSAHRHITVDIAERGNLTIDSLDGRLAASVGSGDVTVYVCRHDGVSISVNKGNIRLKVPDSLETGLDLVGSKVSIGAGLNSAALHWSKLDTLTGVTGTLRSTSGEGGEGASIIRARTLSGSVEVTLQDWISSLKLQSALKEE